jgi:hypothetical protein
MTSPSDYAARLTRLQTLGVGEGVPKDLYVCPEYGTVWIDRIMAPIPNDLATRILESCLWETLRGWADGSSYWQTGEPIYINKGDWEGEYRTLLEAADAVIAHLEANK